MRNYSAKLRHNVVYVFSIFNGDVNSKFGQVPRAKHYTGNKFAKGK